MTHPHGESLQLYSVRDHIQGGLSSTLQRVSGAGFTQVELFNMVDWAGDLKALLPDYGLKAPTAHARTLGADVDLLSEVANSLGVHTLIDPFIDRERWTSESAIADVARDLNAVATRVAQHGLQFGYHNHFWEVATDFSGRTGLEVLVEHLDPAITLEVDVYWASIGGANVPRLLRNLGDRVTALHVKDAPRRSDGALSDDRFDQLPVGQGGIDWGAVLHASPSATLRVVEFDEFRGDVIDGARESLRALRVGVL